jgi:hypothetical protein
VFAQSPAPVPPSPTLDQRIGTQIGALVIEVTSLRMQVEQLQTALKEAQDRVKALEDKHEPKGPPK